MSLRSAYASIFDQQFDSSGNFNGQINANIPGNLNIGNLNTTYRIFLNGTQFTGGSGGSAEPSNWANYEAINNVNVNSKGLILLGAINNISLFASGGDSNIFGLGKNAALMMDNPTVVKTVYAIGLSAALSNGGNHLYAFGTNTGFRNSGNNVFAAGINAAISNGGSNVIAIGNDAGARTNLTQTNNIIAIGVSSGYNNRSSDVIAIGNQAGYNNTGNYSILLGSNPNTSITNLYGDYRFLVYSSDATTPFLYGDMENRRLCVNGSSFSDTAGTNYNFKVSGITFLESNVRIGNVLTAQEGGPGLGALTIGACNTTFQSNVTFLNVVSNASNVTVNGTSTLRGIVSLQSNLNVSGAGAFTGAVSLQSNLNVNGLATISGATIQSNANINGTLTVPTIASLTTLNGTVNFLTPVGSIIMWPMGTAPTGWLICDGTAVSRTTYSNLLLVIGTTYGVGNGSTTFNVPNFQGRFPLGISSTYPLSTAGGATTYTLTSNNLPVHNHAASVTLSNTTHTHRTPDTTHSHGITEPNGGQGHQHWYALPNITDANGGNGIDDAGGSWNDYWHKTHYSTTGITINSETITGSATGDNSVTPTASATVSNSTNANNAFSILNPYLTINYIIKF